MAKVRTHPVDIERVRAYLTPEENEVVRDVDVVQAIKLLDVVPWSPLGVARVVRSALRKGYPEGRH